MNDQVLRVMDNPGMVDPVRLIINMAILQDNPPHQTTNFLANIKIDYVKVHGSDEILSNFPPSNYYIQITTSNGITTKTLVKL